MDNMYVERLWRSPKKGIANYLRYFNEERPHQGLGNRTPDDVFFKPKPLNRAA